MKEPLELNSKSKIRLYSVLGIVVALIIVASLSLALGLFRGAPLQAQSFDGQIAYQDVVTQVNMGPRTPGSPAHDFAVTWMVIELKKAGWQVEVQETQRMGHPIQNVIAKRGSGTPWIILGAHYNSRLLADQDPNPALQARSVPAANDGASGVAVLLELARTLPKNLDKQVWLVMFDAEDQGEFPGWDWILGSQAFADSLQSKPTAVVVIDMIGDANLDIYKERNSAPALLDAIWNQASALGYGSEFIPQYKYSMLDDHTPFLNKGIQAADIIDFDYPYWHTTQDTADKVSAASLEAVGKTLQAWLVNMPAQSP